MSRISTYQFAAGADTLERSAPGEIPDALVEPVQALIATASRRVAEAPLSIYVCADDEAVRARDRLALALAKSLTAHVPSALLVDCDFVRAGLNGIVPQKDALGLLDFLLYGSSMGVITQEAAGGVHVVGTGSFPVTKRMPFVESSFEDAARRLIAHARCALFVGPLFDESGSVHPLTRHVDVVAVVRGAGRDARLDAAEEAAAGERAEVWSLRLAGAPARPAPPPPQRAVPAPSPSAPRPPAPSRSRPAPPSAAPAQSSSLAPRLAIVAFGLLVVAFVGWWFWQNRSPQNAAAPAPPPVEPAASATHDSVTADSVAADSVAPQPVRVDSIAPALHRPLDPADAGGGGGTVLLNSADIHVMDDVERGYRGWYMIHISSFQTSIRAREEVAFLQSREFPVFIVFLDLGAKGKWYRVYAGPFETRDEARNVKKNLDAIPQVRFTRVATIPDS